MDKNTYLNQWAEKLSVPIEQINAEFDRILLEEKSIHPDLSQEQQELRTLKRLALVYKKQMRSPAEGFEGIILGTSDCVDAIANKRREAIEVFKVDPQSAVAQGITDEDGNPLDTKETWNDGRANVNYGKPLPTNNFLRNVWVLAKSNKDASYRFLSMLLTGEKAKNENIPIFTPVRFMAIDKEDKLNSSQFTNFVIDNKLEMPNELLKLLEEKMDFVAIGEIEKYHASVKDDFNRLACVIGDVSALNLEPTSMGSRVLSLEDADAALEDLDAKGLTCWLPPRINIDFAEGSKIVVIGRTSQGNKKDEQGNRTEELGDVTMNVFGVYAIPEFKVAIPKEVNDITEETLEM